jgi:hypothetical protein
MQVKQLESLVLEVGRILVAEGLYPSLDRLEERTGYSAKGRICAARRSLVQRGLWPVEIKPTSNAAAVASNMRRSRERWADPEGDHDVGLNGRSDAEVAEAEQNAREVRAEAIVELPLLPPVLTPGFRFSDLIPKAASRKILSRYKHIVMRATEGLSHAGL